MRLHVFSYQALLLYSVMQPDPCDIMICTCTGPTIVVAQSDHRKAV